MLLYLFFLNKDRRYFDESLAREIYLNSGNKELSVEDLNNKYVCMASLSALINHLEENEHIKLKKECMIIKYHYLENHLNISFQCSLDLELLLNSKFKTSFASLASVFKCQTISGTRMIRSNILQPSTNPGLINARYSSVEEFLNRPDLLNRIKQVLTQYKDFEIQITKFMHHIEDVSESMINHILLGISSIRNSLINIKDIQDILYGNFQSEILTGIYQDLDKNIYLELINVIEKYISENEATVLSSQKHLKKQDYILFMIKDNVDNTLDIMRKIYINTINNIYTEYERIKQETEDPNCKLNFSNATGYYITISERFFNRDVFEIFKLIGKKYQCSTHTLVSLSERIKEIKKDLLNLSILRLLELIKLLQMHITHLQDLSFNIATLDMLCSFAEYSKSLQISTRPVIKTSSVTTNGVKSNQIIVNNSRFPFDIGTIDPNFLIPNDYYLINNFNILMIKGANASGKTTYMKQLALLLIIAQVGCFVPATKFVYNPIKFLFTKFEHNDSIEERNGSFSKEVVEIQKILLNSPNNSLILLDEPFDSRNSMDSYALIWSLIDYFSQNFFNSFVVIQVIIEYFTNLAIFILM